jgi:protein-disulfide isomerase
MSSEKVLNVAISVLSLCVVVITVAIVRREFFTPPPRRAEGPRTIAEWRSYATLGSASGPVDAPLLIVEFADFQCPACGQFERSLQTLRRKYPGQVRTVYRHYPLMSIHPHAYDAALAAECAGQQGKFEAYHDTLFRSQDSIGLLTWGDFARRAGVPDTSRFAVCIRDSIPGRRIRLDIAAGEQLGIRGTPTILVNGVMLTGAPTAPELDSLARHAMSRAIR